MKQILEQPKIICRFCGEECDFLGHNCIAKENSMIKWHKERKKR